MNWQRSQRSFQDLNLASRRNGVSEVVRDLDFNGEKAFLRVAVWTQDVKATCGIGIDGTGRGRAVAQSIVAVKSFAVPMSPVVNETTGFV